ncbi:D-2-hydroxyacid dehydrogenase [Clostridium sp. CAG:265]|uniref:D-2-hydroxyacid dehydrogenase n=1 Tax=Clostridium sp. CAG:265 TaxID=1262787 RepID=UPI000340DF44|nr:D-2-hydroxyacid dehydrogenase [Clostridium sp. CAG:265]CDB74747.1 d-isomer specific 2-hydroxyacid dehydrogenase [Clostridium sp. CAG:265]
MKVLANDGLEISAINEIKKNGIYIETNHFDKEELIENIKNYDVLVVRSNTKVTSDVLEAGAKGNLKLVIRAGVGIDNIDLDYAKKVGIKVSNTPDASSDSVAELALGHMFSVARYIAVANYTMRNGQWNKKQYKGSEIAGKILGIIGMGRIGKALAGKAEALGMKIIYADVLGKQDNLAYEFMDLDNLLKVSDYVSLHVPYDKDKGALISSREISMMKEGAVIINCARGKVVDEEALLEGLNSGKLAGAGIDVFEQEPSKNTELINHERVSVTPHIGASTKEAQERIGKEVAAIVINFNK